jgi:hypothetical protein
MGNIVSRGDTLAVVKGMRKRPQTFEEDDEDDETHTDTHENNENRARRSNAPSPLEQDFREQQTRSRLGSQRGSVRWGLGARTEGDDRSSTEVLSGRQSTAGPETGRKIEVKVVIPRQQRKDQT